MPLSFTAGRLSRTRGFRVRSFAAIVLKAADRAGERQRDEEAPVVPIAPALRRRRLTRVGVLRIPRDVEGSDPGGLNPCLERFLGAITQRHGQPLRRHHVAPDIEPVPRMKAFRREDRLHRDPPSGRRANAPRQKNNNDNA
ncbi:hypothetical protein MKK88_05990 [Methylobacterium sp. E-005]|nr:hypothetical protein [Methylobacterium sp. E-005]